MDKLIYELIYFLKQMRKAYVKKLPVIAMKSTFLMFF